MRNRLAAAFLILALASPALAQSHDPSVGSGNIDRSAMAAPSGQRQPRAGSVPSPGDSSAYARDTKIERAMKICRGCER